MSQPPEFESTTQLDIDDPADPIEQSFMIRIGQSSAPSVVVPMIIELDKLDELQIGRGTENNVTQKSRSVTQVFLDDHCVSRNHACVETRRAKGKISFHLLDCGSTNGTSVNGTLISTHNLTDGDIVETGRTFWKFCRRPIKSAQLLRTQMYGVGKTPLASLSFDLVAQFYHLQQVSEGMIPIIIQGESGTGKTFLSQEIHNLSRRKGQFVVVNCAAIPEGLVESELFGHKKGAFTGAVENKPGLVESANNGTLLLDEIGDLSLPAQTKLLHLLQSRSFTRVGETEERSVDVRFVAATNQNLEQMIQTGTFRGDLYARLDGFNITLPPLRQHPEDIGWLIAEFLGTNEALEMRFTHNAYLSLLLYDWPFNIRQLASTVATCVTVAYQQGEVTLTHLPDKIRQGKEQLVSDPFDEAGDTAKFFIQNQEEDALAPEGTSVLRRVSATEETSGISPASQEDESKAALIRALKQNKGNVTGAARDMKLSRMHVYRLLKRFDLDAKDFR